MRGRGSGNSDEFIREVDEAVRQDRWLQLWKQYGTFIAGGAIAIVIGTGAGVAWRNYQASQRLEDARRYAAAEELLRQDRPAEAATAFLQLAEEAGGGYDVVARLRAAEAQVEAGEKDAADPIRTPHQQQLQSCSALRFRPWQADRCSHPTRCVPDSAQRRPRWLRGASVTPVQSCTASR